MKKLFKTLSICLLISAGSLHAMEKEQFNNNKDSEIEADRAFTIILKELLKNKENKELLQYYKNVNLEFFDKLGRIHFSIVQYMFIKTGEYKTKEQGTTSSNRNPKNPHLKYNFPNGPKIGKNGNQGNNSLLVKIPSNTSEKEKFSAETEKIFKGMFGKNN